MENGLQSSQLGGDDDNVVESRAELSTIAQWCQFYVMWKECYGKVN